MTKSKCDDGVNLINIVNQYSEKIWAPLWNRTQDLRITGKYFSTEPQELLLVIGMIFIKSKLTETASRWVVVTLSVRLKVLLAFYIMKEWISFRSANK